MKILVVDDEALLVKGIRFNLQNEGYEVITGSNGVEAVNAAMKDQPDLIVLDVPEVQVEVVYPDGTLNPKVDAEDFSIRVYQIVLPHFK